MTTEKEIRGTTNQVLELFENSNNLSVKQYIALTDEELTKDDYNTEYKFELHIIHNEEFEKLIIKARKVSTLLKINAIIDENIEECEICDECNTALLPDDECYEKHDGKALCSSCSILCEGCNKYYIDTEGVLDEHGFCCNNCNKKESVGRLHRFGQNNLEESTTTQNKIFTKIVTIQQHDILITYPTRIIPDPHVIDKLIDDINYELTQINDSGTVSFNSDDYKWEIIQPKSYLDEKVEILEDKGEVVFEHNCMIYTISESSEGGYETNMYDLHTNNFISGDELEADDGGHCSGNARDAVYFMIEEG